MTLAESLNKEMVSFGYTQDRSLVRVTNNGKIYTNEENKSLGVALPTDMAIHQGLATITCNRNPAIVWDLEASKVTWRAWRGKRELDVEVYDRRVDQIDANTFAVATAFNEVKIFDTRTKGPATSSI